MHHSVLRAIRESINVCVDYLNKYLFEMLNFNCDYYSNHHPLDDYFRLMNNETGNCGELLNRLQVEEKSVETLDVYTNEVMHFKEYMLKYQCKKYTMNLVSRKWKKDCRMWLWKNNLETKMIGDLYNNDEEFTKI